MTERRCRGVIEQLFRDAANGTQWRIKASSLKDGAVGDIYLSDIVRRPEIFGYLIKVAQGDLRAVIRQADNLGDADALRDVVEYLDMLRVIALSGERRSLDGFWPVDPDKRA